MAGGLLAVNREWFWDLGGYDEETRCWGGENIEYSLRIWMCGGRLECAPCSRVYHIFRRGGAPFKCHGPYVWKNRLRAARVWMDEFFEITLAYNTHEEYRKMGPWPAGFNVESDLGDLSQVGLSNCQ